LIDYDSNSLKIVDCINKRLLQPEFANYPIIPIVILLNEQSSAKDVEEQMNSIGGTFRIIPYPYKSQTVAISLLEVAYLSKNVENTYRDLKKAAVAAAKFPYLPVFDKKSAAKIKHIDGELVKVSIATSMSTLDYRMEEIEDVATDTESLLPDFLEEFKFKKRINSHQVHSITTNSLYKGPKAGTGLMSRASFNDPNVMHNILGNRTMTRTLDHHDHTTAGGMGGMLDERAEVLDHASDMSLAMMDHPTDALHNNNNNNNKDHNNDKQLFNTQDMLMMMVNHRHYHHHQHHTDDEEDDEEDYDDEDFLMRSRYSSLGVRIDSKTFTEGLLGDESESQSQIQKESHTNNQDNRSHNNNNNSSSSSYHSSAIKKIIGKEARPFWSGAIGSIDKKRTTTESVNTTIINTPKAKQQSQSQDKQKRKDMEHDIRLFVNKEKPKSFDLKTVGGLNKKVADQQWKQLRTSYHVEGK
jgi:hypothetical protein